MFLNHGSTCRKSGSDGRGGPGGRGQTGPRGRGSSRGCRGHHVRQGALVQVGGFRPVPACLPPVGKEGMERKELQFCLLSLHKPLGHKS